LKSAFSSFSAQTFENSYQRGLRTFLLRLASVSENGIKEISESLSNLVLRTNDLFYGKNCIQRERDKIAFIKEIMDSCTVEPQIIGNVRCYFLFQPALIVCKNISIYDENLKQLYKKVCITGIITFYEARH
jgi:hypothetical protein